MKWLTVDEYIGSKKIAVIHSKVINSFPLHWHDFFEIEVMLGGKAVQILNGNKYYMEAGYMYMLTPTDFHEFLPIDSVEIFNIMLPDSLLSDSFLNMLSETNGDIIIKTKDKEFEEIKKYVLL